MSRRIPALRFLLVILLFATSTLRCSSPPNAQSLWLSYSQSEINLVLIDFEPPPF